jgi:endonuclease-3 related protein
MQPLILYAKLYSAYGKQDWWPASRGKNKEFEVCIGAILTQNTAWSNVEKAISSLKSQNSLSIQAISGMRPQKLARLVKPAGYYNQKAGYLKEFCNHVLQKHSGKLQKLFSQQIPALRSELLSLKGIGPETADSIILYAAGKPVFVIDAYTKRLNERLALKPELKTYSELQSFFHSKLPKNTQLFNEFHALIVKHAKESCRKKPACEKCFLKKDCCFPKQGF